MAGHFSMWTPISETEAGGQMFVGVVVDGDDQIIVADDLVDVRGADTAELRTIPSGDRNGPRVHCLGGVGRSLGGRIRAALCHKAAASCEWAELWVHTNSHVCGNSVRLPPSRTRRTSIRHRLVGV
jgi:hypothetical protein